MKNSKSASLFCGAVFIFDFLILSFVFFCFSIFFIFDGNLSFYAALAGVFGLFFGLATFFVFGKIAEKYDDFNGVFKDKTCVKYCFFCWIFRKSINNN